MFKEEREQLQFSWKDLGNIEGTKEVYVTYKFTGAT